MRKTRLFFFLFTGLGTLLSPGARGASPTFCNPLNLPYRFQHDPPISREGADPTMVLYKNEYWLFVSKSGGYWHSPDCLNWTYVKSTFLPIENYAPTAEVLNDHLIWGAFGSGIYSSDDPATDHWTKVSDTNCGGDPDLFLDDDGRLYLFSGCSNHDPITGVELDVSTLKPIGTPVTCILGDAKDHGWEALKPGEWFEGSWMNKYKGTYYLQFAAPGTEISGYGDGVYTSKNPLGPYTYAPYSPFSFKPTGFATSAGHSSTFQDLSGQYWHIATMLIGVNHSFERRIGLFPAGFTNDGQLICSTYLGDYPQYAPGTDEAKRGLLPGWMLLSYHKPAEASSTLEGFPASNAFDENIRDWWSAQTGNKGEWLKVDLGKVCRIEAIQTNFSDQNASLPAPRAADDVYHYITETSNDGMKWDLAIDRSQNTTDVPHDYVQLPSPVMARYVRLTNIHCPAGSNFSVSGLRVFGNGLGLPPDRVTGVTAERSDDDARKATVSWDPVKNADFYIVRYGIAAGKLFSNYQIYKGNQASLNALNKGVPYYATVDAVNDSGATRGTQIVPIP